MSGGIYTLGLVTDYNKDGMKTGITNTIHIERDDELSMKGKAVSPNNIIPLSLRSDFQRPFKEGDLALLTAEDYYSTNDRKTCNEDLGFLEC